MSFVLSTAIEPPIKKQKTDDNSLVVKTIQNKIPCLTEQQLEEENPEKFLPYDLEIFVGNKSDKSNKGDKNDQDDKNDKDGKDDKNDKDDEDDKGVKVIRTHKFIIVKHSKILRNFIYDVENCSLGNATTQIKLPD